MKSMRIIPHGRYCNATLHIHITYQTGMIIANLN